MLVRKRLQFTFGVAVLLLQISCELSSPKWPLCDNDQHCLSSNGPNTVNYYCVNRLCVPCRKSTNCPPKHNCSNGYCKPNHSTFTKPVAGLHYTEQVCQRDGDTPCDGDKCKICRAHMDKPNECVSYPSNCTSNASCEKGFVCKVDPCGVKKCVSANGDSKQL